MVTDAKPVVVLALAVSLGVLGLGCRRQSDRAQGRATAEPRPLNASADPVNQLVRETTVQSLIVSLDLDGTTVTLGSAYVARVPPPRRQVVRPGDETITLIARSAGQPTSTLVVPDPVWLIEEGVARRRQTQRQVVAIFPGTQRTDSVDVRLGDSGTVQHIDVTSAYRPTPVGAKR